MRKFTIGQVSSRSEVAIDTIRYYEREGLIPPPARRPSGYREYPVETVDRLRFIRRAKVLGFTLSEIVELLTLTEQSRSDMHGMKAAAEAKLTLVNTKVKELHKIQQALRLLVDACPGHGSIDRCPIVHALKEDAS
jgi:MerR family copper efflux transcriptional regulator